MNRIRIGLAVTVLLGVIYSGAGLFESLTQFGVGMAVAAAAMIGYGLVDFVEARQAEKRCRYRAEVWARRDYQALQDMQLRPGIYVRRADDEAA